MLQRIVLGYKQKNVCPEVLNLQNHTFHVLNIYLLSIVVFEIDGGEHIGSKRTASLDRQKENICKNYGIKLIRIPNSAVKDYESIIGIFEFTIGKIQNLDEAFEQMSLFEE